MLFTKFVPRLYFWDFREALLSKGTRAGCQALAIPVCALS